MVEDARSAEQSRLIRETVVGLAETREAALASRSGR